MQNKMFAIFGAAAVIIVVYIAVIEPSRQPKPPVSNEPESLEATVVRWLDAAMADDLPGMLAVSDGIARNQTPNVLQKIHEEEQLLKTKYGKHHRFSMGPKGAYKAMLFSADGKTNLMKITMIAEERDNKFKVIQASID